jgi:DNA-binding transcriptional regulator YhcF (GntR family)
MFVRPNPTLGTPIYVQLMEQVKHAIETGAVRPGEQLPGYRPLAEALVINVNTVAKAYRELAHAGVIELRQGAGAFVSGDAHRVVSADRVRSAQPLAAETVATLRKRGLKDDEIRRLVEAELAAPLRAGGQRA